MLHEYLLIGTMNYSLQLLASRQDRPKPNTWAHADLVLKPHLEFLSLIILPSVLNPYKPRYVNLWDPPKNYLEHILFRQWNQFWWLPWIYIQRQLVTSLDMRHRDPPLGLVGTGAGIPCAWGITRLTLAPMWMRVRRPMRMGCPERFPGTSWAQRLDTRRSSSNDFK